MNDQDDNFYTDLAKIRDMVYDRFVKEYGVKYGLQASTRREPCSELTAAQDMTARRLIDG